MINKTDTFDSFLNKNKEGDHFLQNFYSFKLFDSQNLFNFDSEKNKIEIPQNINAGIIEIVSEQEKEKNKKEVISKINLDKKNLIRNLSQEIFQIIKEFKNNGFTFFSRKMIFERLKIKFENEKAINIQKRMYDVINIFVSLEILKKKDNSFHINENVIDSLFNNRHNVLIDEISDLENKKKEIKKLENHLFKLQKKIQVFDILCQLNNKDCELKEFKEVLKKKKIKKKKNKKEEDLVSITDPKNIDRIYFPFRLLELEKEPKINEAQNKTLVTFKNYKLMQDYQIFEKIIK
jgi:hypothetical protein